MGHDKWRKLSIGLATVVLALSVASLAQEIITDYNRAVEHEQYEKQMIAKGGPTFAVDNGGIDYSKRNRHLIFVVCIAAFILSLFPRTIWISFLSYCLTVPLIFQWITMMMRDISYNELYMSDSPYLLRIATPLDWALFASLAVTLDANLVFLLVDLRRRAAFAGDTPIKS